MLLRHVLALLVPSSGGVLSHLTFKGDMTQYIS